MKNAKNQYRASLWAIAALSVVFFGGIARSAPDFTLSPAASSVLAPAKAHQAAYLADGVTMRLFYSAVPEFVQSSISTDGVAWSGDAGQRISAGGANSPDENGVASFGMMHNASVYTAYYVGISSANRYSILRATSTNMLDWNKTAAFRIQFGSGMVDSLHPLDLGGGKVMLYYTHDYKGLNNPADYRAYRALSVDGGDTFGAGTPAVPDTAAYGLYISALTSGSKRLHIISPLGDGTTTQVLSFISPDGYSFSRESGVRFSTTVYALSSLAVLRSTDNYCWHSFLSMTRTAAGAKYAYHGASSAPVISGFSPARVYIDTTTPRDLSVTIDGEIFSEPVGAVALAKGGESLAAVGPITRVSDMRLTGVFRLPVTATPGRYSLTVSNKDGSSATLPNVLLAEYPPSSVTLRNNLFRPLKGEKMTATVSNYYSGGLAARVYTLNGGLARTLPLKTADTFEWDGRTDGGGLAASGLYLLRVQGSGLDSVNKIVLIK